MNIEKIKEIVNDDSICDKDKTNLIIHHLSSDMGIIPLLLRLLETERKRNENIISECNEELSVAICHIENPNLLKENKTFLAERWKNFYNKWEDFVGYCFANGKFKSE